MFPVFQTSRVRYVPQHLVGDHNTDQSWFILGGLRGTGAALDEARLCNGSYRQESVHHRCLHIRYVVLNIQKVPHMTDMHEQAMTLLLIMRNTALVRPSTEYQISTIYSESFDVDVTLYQRSSTYIMTTKIGMPKMLGCEISSSALAYLRLNT